MVESMSTNEPLMPSEIDEEVHWFDRLSERADKIVASPAWFTLSALGVVLWCLGLPIAGFLNDTYHLLLNSPTTALTFLIVSTSACTSARFAKAVHHKLNAMAKAQADMMRAQCLVMKFLAETASKSYQVPLLDGMRDMEQDINELEAAVGLEHRESS